MFEAITFEVILQRMLDKIPNNIDKREGSIIYDALAPAAVELQNMYIDLDVILQESFADTSSRTYLIKRASERGLSPYPATYAVLKGVFNIDIPIGSRFSLEEYNYTVIEKIEDNTFKLQCETIGVEGNRHFGTLIPIEYIRGLESAEITELLIPGENEEDTEEFRQRYFDSLDPQSFGGNIADYKQKTKSIQGIGGVKVYPVWNGGGTVKLVILNSEFEKPTTELIDLVQTTIDPIQNKGIGLGLAPVGHVVTVTGVEETTINIELEIIFQNGGTWENTQTRIQEIITSYLKELNKTWEDNNSIIIRISQLESRLLEIEQILDITNTKINGLEANLTLGPDNIAVIGVITNV